MFWWYLVVHRSEAYQKSVQNIPTSFYTPYVSTCKLKLIIISRLNCHYNTVIVNFLINSVQKHCFATPNRMVPVRLVWLFCSVYHSEAIYNDHLKFPRKGMKREFQWNILDTYFGTSMTHELPDTIKTKTR